MVYDETMRAAARRVQVNVPYRMLVEEGFFELFLTLGLNPELGMDIPTLEGYDLAHFEKTAATFSRAGARLTLHGPFEGVDPGSADVAMRTRSQTHLERLVKAVEVMRPACVVCHTGFTPAMDPEELPGWRERSRRAWAELASAMASLGSRLLLENVYEPSPAEMAGITDGLDIGLCLDTGHLNAYGDGDITGWVKTLGPRTREVHLHDNHGTTDDHLPPGQGDIDFGPVLELAGRQPLIVTLEPHSEADLPPALEFLLRNPVLLQP